MRQAVVGAVLLAMGCGGSEAQPAVSSGADVGATSPDVAPAPDLTPPPPPPTWCEGTTSFLYDPLDGTLLGAFPDDFYTKVDAATPTGLRVDLTTEGAPWIAAVPGTYGDNVAELNDLDGWGTTAGIILRFSASVKDVLPTGVDATTGGGAVRLVRLDGDKAVEVPFEVRYTDDDTTALLWPLVPLSPKTQHAVVVTSAQKAVDGQCIAPSPALRSLLDGTATDPRLVPLVPRYQALLQKTGLVAQDVSAAVVFTTQSIVDGDLAVLADTSARTYAWAKAPICKQKTGYRACEGTFKGSDYRSKRVFAGGAPQKELEYPVSVWLPDGKAPFPTILFGHGIGGDRSQGGIFADFLASLGFATVAIDAPWHGKHPAGSGGGGQLSVAAFFAIDLMSLSIEGRELRDNFRQSAYDKLQVVRLIEDAPDVDGDGQADLDADRLAYFGVSLGGIMGPELMALTDRIGAAVLDVCGGRLTTIMTDSEQFGSFISFLSPKGATPGDIDRFFTMAQALVERADPANYAPNVLRDRLEGAGTRIPQVLLQIGVGDEVIPNTASWYLSRAFGLPILPPVAVDIDGVSVEKKLPASGNAGGGAASVGLFQIDRVTMSKGAKPEKPAHNTTPGSAEALTQSIHFLGTWIDGGLSDMIDPFAELGTPPL